jgi:phosphatidylcholine synthase
MSDPDFVEPRAALKTAAAFGVHVFTAIGAALALLAIMAAAERRWTLMFVWLGVALVVDAIDGTFARLLHVKVLVPRFSGEVLDLVVDILTYVFVPAYALAVGGLLPDPLAVPLSVLVAVTGALYFADQRMKSADNYFIGFPAIWNLAAFYLFLLRLDPWAGAAVVAALCVLTFVPVPFVHPFRVVKLRALSLAMLAAGLVLATMALVYGLAPPVGVTAALCAVGIYFVAIGLMRLKRISEV